MTISFSQLENVRPKCYGVEQKLEDRDKHPINCKDKHVFHPVEVRDVAEHTKDMDEVIPCEIFDTRQSFLCLCRGSNYQFNTLRRAKHSTMMVLYHLHSPTLFSCGITCNMCQQDTEAGQIWRCEICPRYDLCNSCFQKHAGAKHLHQLKLYPSTAEGEAENLEVRQIQVLQLRDMLDLLVHASQCRHPRCQHRDCLKIKGLFRHGIQCKLRATGGCILCQKMWYLLQLHARNCHTKPGCHVPRCRDVKDHLKRFQEQSDTRRRASVMEMIRQQATDAELDKIGHLAISEAVMQDTMDEDYYYVADVVRDKMGHLSLAEVLDTMDEHHQSVDDEWMLV
ncbi:hypothetical protein MKX03_000462 [Papaver bracteatum]|nr:hypothetical protein MKX03_000462 [Papaver bracteatum]